MIINSKVRVVGFGGKEWIGTLRGTTENQMSIVRDEESRDWAISSGKVYPMVPLRVGDLVTSTLGEGTSTFKIVATEIDTDTGEELYICRSTYSDASWNSRKRYAYSNSDLMSYFSSACY